MTNISDVTYRFSNTADYKAICELSVNAGVMPDVDYIQESYPQLMKDPLFYGAVAECNGEVIAFGVAMVQLNGTKLFSRSGRVKPEWRSHGIYGKLKKFIQKSLHQSTYPQLKFEEFGTHNTNLAIQRVIDNPHYTEVYKRSYLTYALGEETLPSRNPDDFVHDIGVDGICRMMQDPGLCSQILTPRIFVGLLNFEPKTSEIELIKMYNPLVLATYVDDEHSMSELSIGVQATSKLYIIHWMPSTQSGTKSAPQKIHEHFKRQFLRMKDIVPNGSCQITFTHINEKDVKEAAKSLLLTPIASWATELFGFRTQCFG